MIIPHGDDTTRKRETKLRLCCPLVISFSFPNFPSVLVFNRVFVMAGAGDRILGETLGLFSFHVLFLFCRCAGSGIGVLRIVVGTCFSGSKSIAIVADGRPLSWNSRGVGL